MNDASSASRPGAPRGERTEQQREAVADPGRDVFLRAGAGTGKTTVLVDRFCAAARDPEIGVEGVLAFTFTERAADQLRRRIRVALPGMEEKVDRAWISTIHGFCRRLLASHPAAAGLDPRFRVIDEAEGDRLAARAFDEALDSLVSEGEPAALELAASNRQLLGMTRSAYDELRSQGMAAPELPDPPPTDPAARISELAEAAERAHAACAEASGAKALANLERMGRAARLDPGAEPGLELLDELAALRLDGGGKAFETPDCEAYRRALERVREAVAGVAMKDAYEQLRALIRRFGERYERLKAERSALDFEDLQLQAVALLRRSERLRERYRSQFRALLVDEFQDTNALQLALVEALRGPDTRLFLVGDEFQSIYGFRHADVDVYRRQHRRFASGDEPRGAALPLTGNFRAAPELLAATNAIGGAILPGFEPLSAGLDEPAPGLGQPAVELALIADDKKGWGAPEVGLRPLPDDPSSPSKLAEARVLASRLRELVDAGEDPAEIVVLIRAFTHVGAFERALREAGLDPYVVGGRGFWSQQQIEDMRAVLAVIANPLDDESLFGALASPAGGAVLPDTLWLLRQAATEPAPEEGGFARLRHVWPLLTEMEELESGGANGGGPQAEALAAIPDEERERLRAFTARLRELRARGAEGGLESLVERAASAFGYDLAVLMRESGRERWANVRKLMRLAREFEAREGSDLRGFIAYLDSRAAARDREAEAATRAEGHAGVRVMTVHAAKGLEFGVVAVADLGRGLQLAWSPLRVQAPAEDPDAGETARVGVQLGRLGRPAARLHDYQELAELAADRDAEEEARLAYVAATRAKRRLLLSGTFTKGALKKEPASRQSIAAQLIRGLLGGEAADAVVELEPAADGAPSGRLAVRVLRPVPGLGAELAPAAADGAAEPPTGTVEPPLRRDPVPPALAGGLSYSALSGFERCGYRFYVERMLGIGGPEEPAAAQTPGEGDEGATVASARRRFGPGVAVHSLLEWSARHRWRAPDAERIAAAIRAEGLEPDDELAAHVGALVGGWLRSPLREEIGDAAVSAEVPFVLPVGGALVRGSIDLLARRADGSALVVDYKSDRIEGEGPAELAERYAVQRDLYALAAAGRGPVETAYVFLERPEAAVRTGFDDDALEAARARIEAVLARLAAGEFAVTVHPHRALCHDCPARERLCSHETAAQMRDAPEPAIVPIPRSRREAGSEPAPTAEPPSAASGSQLTLVDP